MDFSAASHRRGVGVEWRCEARKQLAGKSNKKVSRDFLNS